MYQRRNLGVAQWGLLNAGVTCGALLGCAGTDVLDVDNETRVLICDTYGCEGQPPGSGGASGAGGAGVAGAGVTAGTGGAMVAGGAGGSTVAGGAGGMMVTGGGTCDSFPVIAERCGSGCHVEGSSFGVTPFADSREQIAALVGATSASAGDGCGSLLDPANPTASFIYTKVAGTQIGSCGGMMPLGGQNFDDEELACLESWISGL